LDDSADDGDLLTIAAELVDSRLRAGFGIEPLLMLDGPRGSAVLTLAIEAGAIQEGCMGKARLMATAFEAGCCVVVLPVRLFIRGKVPGEAILIVRVSAETRSARLWSVGRHGLMAAPEAPAITHVPTALEKRFSALLPVAASASERKRAWQRLADLGVSIDSSERTVH
jgi:hypothetical protein